MIHLHYLTLKTDSGRLTDPLVLILRLGSTYGPTNCMYFSNQTRVMVQLALILKRNSGQLTASLAFKPETSSGMHAKGSV